MTTLHIIVSHQPPDLVRRQLGLLELVTPGISRLIAYGGTRANFAALSDIDAIFLEDESLRGEIVEQCFNELLFKTHRFLGQSGTTVDLIHVTEYDHLILSPHYFEHLAQVMAESKCDFLGEGCNIKTTSNWFPFFTWREHRPLLDFLRDISVREIKTEICGCLLNGYTLSTRVLDALVNLPPLPRVYSEVLFPSAAYHLGFRIGDIGAYSSMFRYVRHRPTWTKDEITDLLAREALCCHPFKDVADYDAIKESLFPSPEESEGDDGKSMRSITGVYP